MKRKNINTALPALLKLKDAIMPIRKAFQVREMINSANSVYADTARYENELLEKHKGQVSDGDIIFQTPDDARNFKAEYEEFSNVDIELDMVEVELEIDIIGDILMTPADIERLRGFVRFV